MNSNRGERKGVLSHGYQLHYSVGSWSSSESAANVCRTSILGARIADLAISFVGSVQIFSRKTSTSLKNSALVAYPVQAVLLNFSVEYTKGLIQSGTD